jgi:DNA-binding transcriptional MerR regulator
MFQQNERTFSIGDASELTGVSQKKLRSLESKYIPAPARIVCGKRAYRRYPQELIDLIVGIKKYQEQGFLLSVAAKKASEEISQELKTE